MSSQEEQIAQRRANLEALELGRTFSTEDSVKFINGMLDAIRKKIER